MERLEELIKKRNPLWLASQVKEEAEYYDGKGVMVPPCDVGDKLYIKDGERTKEAEVIRVVCRRVFKGQTQCTIFVKYENGNIGAVFGENLGKEFFASLEEAKRVTEDGEGQRG